MHIKKYLSLLMLVLCISSCAHKNKTFSKCPDFKKSKINQAKIKIAKVKKKKSSKESFAVGKKRTRPQVNQPEELTSIDGRIAKRMLALSLLESRDEQIDETLLVNLDDSIPFVSRQKNSSEDEGECDVLVTTSGENINCIVREVTEESIKFVMCNESDGPVISVEKSSIRLIKYQSGAVQMINSKSDEIKNKRISDYSRRRTHRLALLSLVIGIFGFIFITPLLGLGAIASGLVAILRIRKEPEQYKGTGISLVGMVLGSVALVIALLLI